MASCPAVTSSHSSGVRPAGIQSAMNERRRAQAAVAWRWVVAGVTSVWMLMVCKAIIGGASAFDTYLTIKYAESLDVYEQNPVGRWLMGLDHGPVAQTQQIAAFITAKFLGTLLVLMAIQGVAYWRSRLAGLVAIPVAAFQLSLVAHLLFGPG